MLTSAALFYSAVVQAFLKPRRKRTVELAEVIDPAEVNAATVDPMASRASAAASALETKRQFFRTVSSDAVKPDVSKMLATSNRAVARADPQTQAAYTSALESNMAAVHFSISNLWRLPCSWFVS